MSAVAWAEDRIGEWADENALEDEAHQRNQQTADHFPPGTTVYLGWGPYKSRWIVDSRWPNGDITVTRQRARIYVTADQLWRIDPTR